MFTIPLGRSVASSPARSMTTRAFSSVNTFGVVGSGQMGTGIAIVAARQGVAKDVIVIDNAAAALKNSEKFVENWVAKEKDKGRMTDEDSDKLKSVMKYCLLKDIPSTLDFVVEAVTENFNVKKQVYSDLESDGKMSDSTIVASNTSSISITKLAATVGNPERFIGMHFMNPVPVMPLVEVIRGIQTSDATHKTTLDLIEAMKKTPGTSKDIPGFIANRILMPYINEACFCLQEGIATREDIDKIMKFGTNVPMGPLTLADFIGLDTCLAIMRVLHEELGDSKYRPAPLLVNYVQAGYLGKKSKRGFYEY